MVVDDASSDGTVSLLKDRYRNKISIISCSTNKGQSFCRNQGVESCRSDCICFLDSDDFLESDAIEKRVSLFNESRDIVVSFGLFRTPKKKQHPLLHHKKRRDVLSLEEYLREKSWCNNSGFLIDRELFLCDGMYDLRLRNKEDIELMLRLLCKHSFSYCGAELGEVREVCGNNRARYDYQRIISQGTLFSNIVLNNPLLKHVISESSIQKLICSDIEEELRALYKLGRYADYRSFYRTALTNGHILNTRRFFKRYLLSYVREIPIKVLQRTALRRL